MMANGLALKQRPPLRSHKDSAACLGVCATCEFYHKPVKFHCQHWTGNIKRKAILSNEQCKLGRWHEVLSKATPPKHSDRPKPFTPTIVKGTPKTVMMVSTDFNREFVKAFTEACRVHKIDVIPRFGMNDYVKNITDYENIVTWGIRQYSGDWYAKQNRNILFLENGLFCQGHGFFIDAMGKFSDSQLCKGREYELSATEAEYEQLRLLTKHSFGWDLLSGAYDKDGPILYCIQLERDAPCKHYFPTKIDGLDNIAGGLKLLAEYCPDRPVIIRPHPKHQTDPEDRADWEAHVEHYRSLFKPDWRLEADGSVYKVIPKCSAVVTVNSTVATEALSLGIPVATLGQGAYTGAGVTLECAKAPERLQALFGWGECKPCEKAGRDRGTLQYLAAVLRHQVPRNADLATILENQSFDAWARANVSARSPTSFSFPPGATLEAEGIPKILNFIWIGSQLPDFAKYNIEKWQEMNPEYAVMIHGKEILHVEHEFMYSKLNRYDHWADVLKWSALREHGGWTIDADTVPLRPMSTFTETLNPDSDFVAVGVPPRDEHRGMIRCDMGFLGATPNARIWSSVQWFLNGNTEDEARKGRALGGIRCMDYVLRTVPHLVNRQDSKLYCPYSRKDKECIAKGRAYFKALRAGEDVSKYLKWYNERYGYPLAWHLWRAAV